MAVNPLDFTQPLAGISETLDRSGAGFGGAGLPGAGAQALPGAALRFAGALRQALESGGPEALDQMAQAGMGAQFMTLMEGGEGAGQAQGLSDMHALLDALEGTGQGDGAGFAGLSGGTVPGGKGVQALIRALSAGGLSPVAGSQDAAAAPGPWGVQGPERADGLRRVGASQGPAGGLAPGARVGAPAAQPTAASEAPAREADAAGAARTARAHRAYGKAAAPGATGASGVDILGLLSARFESGGDIGAVGYDRVGGTSYGSYQISSRAGTFSRFLEFLDSAAPDIAGRLRQAGPANTGSTRGAMPEAWKAVAREEPERFSRLQHEFISQTHYLPALRKITDLTGVDLSGRHQAIAQVLWSTAVQHGASGSARIFSAALDALGGMAQGPDFERGLIREVYARRAGRFGSSDARVQGAVQSRFAREMGAALSMLDGAATLDHNA